MRGRPLHYANCELAVLGGAATEEDVEVFSRLRDHLGKTLAFTGNAVV